MDDKKRVEVGKNLFCDDSVEMGVSVEMGSNWELEVAIEKVC